MDGEDCCFHGRKSAGIDCTEKIIIYVLAELGAMGIPKGHLACNAPLGQVATATMVNKEGFADLPVNTLAIYFLMNHFYHITEKSP